MKSFQLRAARSVIGIGVREVALYLNISRTIVSRWENLPALTTLKSTATNPEALIFYFNQYKIQFPSSLGISLDTNNFKNNSIKVMSRFQLRASRAILGISQKKLAELTNTNQSTINYLEVLKNTDCISNITKNINTRIYKDFFETKHIRFPNDYSIELASSFIDL